MPSMPLTLSCGAYDRTRPLIDGKVSTPGLDPIVIPLPSAERHARFVTKFEFDVPRKSDFPRGSGSTFYVTQLVPTAFCCHPSESSNRFSGLVCGVF